MNRYEQIVQNAGFEIRTLELDTFSSARSLNGESDETFLIIEMGARTSNVVLIEKRNVIISRNLDIGGSEITRTIASNMNIAWKRAEQFKKQEKDFFVEKKSISITPTLELIAKEAARVIESYSGNQGKGKIKKVVLSGGVSNMKGIDRFFSDYLNINCVIGNPWSKIEVDSKIKPFAEKISGSFSVSAGLALKGVEDYMRAEK